MVHTRERIERCTVFMGLRIRAILCVIVECMDNMLLCKKISC